MPVEQTGLTISVVLQYAVDPHSTDFRIIEVSRDTPQEKVQGMFVA